MCFYDHYIGGTDFEQPSQPIVFGPSTSFRQCTDVSILPDAIVEGNEMFSVELIASDLGVSFTRAVVEVVIIDAVDSKYLCVCVFVSGMYCVCRLDFERPGFESQLDLKFFLILPCLSLA